MSGNIYHFIDKPQRIVFWYPQDILGMFVIFFIGDALGHLFLGVMLSFFFVYIVNKLRKTILKKINTYSFTYWYFPSAKTIPVPSYIREYIG